MFHLILLVLIPTVLARIEVNIKVGDSADQTWIELLGSSVEPISDDEKDTFKLAGNRVLEAAYHYHGGDPSSIYFRNPTPWGDVFTQYGWTPVSRTLVPKTAKIVGFRTNSSLVDRREYQINSSAKAVYDVGVFKDVPQGTVIFNSWSKSLKLTVGQNIEYAIGFGPTEIGGMESVLYSSSWGQDRSKSETVRVGSTSAVEVELEPGQAVVTELIAERATMKIEVLYEASLDGNVLCSYKEPFRSHFFWRYDVNALLHHANVPRIVRSKETVDIEFYWDATIVVRDLLTGNLMLTRKASIIPLRQLEAVPNAGTYNMVPVDFSPKV